MHRDVRVADAQSFVDAHFEVPPFVVDPIIVRGGIHLIYGRAGAGKTQLVLTIARDVINGTKLFGEYDTTGGRVCYFGVDMPLQMLQERVGRMVGELAEPANLLIAAHDKPIDITTVREDADWLERIQAFGPDLIFLDTLHKIHRLDENASQSVAQVYGHLKRVFGGDVAIGLVHHEGKSHPDPRVERDEADRQRGSSAWVDDSDLGLRVKNFHNPISGGNVTVSFPRVRFSEQLDPVTLEMNDETLLLDRKIDPTAVDLVARFLSLHPEAEKIDVVTWLRENHDYSKKQGYRAINQVQESS